MRWNSHCGKDKCSCAKMSDRNLAKRDDVHSDASPEGQAMAMEAESSVVIKPVIAFTCESGLKEEEFHTEVDILSTERAQYFSTPVQRECKRRASTIIEPQENLLGYKSFFRLECDEIVHQLHSRAVQGWSASKRKLEELDISTIEAEPLPLLCCTLKSVWDETTHSVKKRKLDYQGNEANISLNSCLTKHSSPGLGTSRVQGLEKVHGLNQCRKGDRKSIQEKSSLYFNSESHSKCSVLLKTCRAAHQQSNQPAGSEKCVPARLTSEACSPLLYYSSSNKMSFQHESSTPGLEFRSFFAAECEKICNQLKKHDTEMMCGNVSCIEAEPPPVLSATINSTIISEQDNTCKENCTMRVSQLDLEKMNINYSITKRAFVVQEAPDTVTCNGDATGPMENVMFTDSAQGPVIIYEAMSLANTTQDIYNGESANGVLQKIKIVHSRFPIANITQDINRLHDKMTEANTTQGIVKSHGNGSLADAPQVNVRMCEDIVKVYDKESVENYAHVLTMCDDVSIVNSTKVIVAEGDGTAMNALQENLTTYSKMPLPEDPAGTETTTISLANDTQDIVALCNEGSAVQAMQNIRTACSEKSAADATQEVMSMFNEVCVAGGTEEMMTTKTLLEVDVTVDIGTIFNTGIDPEDKHRNILHARRNIVSDNAPLQNVTLLKSDANVVNDIQDIVSVHSEVTPNSGINKTFTHCKVTEPNVTHDISTMNRETVTNVQDLTQLISYMDAPNILPDIGIIDEKPKINATYTLMSILNEVTANDSLQDRGDLTKVRATNCMMLEDPSTNVCIRPEKQSRQIWPIGVLAHSSPCTGNMSNIKDSTYNLDLTNIVHEESMFNRPLSFITSTPLPSLSSHVFIKKSCELHVRNEQENINKAILAQRAAMSAMMVTGQSLGGDPKTRGGISRGSQYPNISRSTIPKVRESIMPRPEYCVPAPRSTLALTALKTPHVAKAALTKKDQVALGRTTMRPPLAPTSLTRQIMQYGQPCKSGTSNGILQQPESVNSIRTSKEIFKKRIDVSRFPASSLVRPPFGLSTPGCQIYAGKVESIPGLQSTAHVRKVSSVNPTSATGFAQSGTVLQCYTVIRPTNPVGSQISFRMKPRASGLPIRKKQEAFLRPSTK